MPEIISVRKVTDGECCCHFGTAQCACCLVEDMPLTVPVCIQVIANGMTNYLSGTAERSGCGYVFQIGWVGNDQEPGYDQLQGSVFQGLLTCGRTGAAGTPVEWGAYLHIYPSAFMGCLPGGVIVIDSTYDSGPDPIVLEDVCNPFSVSLRWNNLTTPFGNPDCVYDVIFSLGEAATLCGDGTGTGTGTGTSTGTQGTGTATCADCLVTLGTTANVTSDGTSAFGCANLTHTGSCLFEGDRGGFHIVLDVSTAPNAILVYDDGAGTSSTWQCNDFNCTTGIGSWTKTAETGSGDWNTVVTLLGSCA